jgi:hypothetical protein
VVLHFANFGSNSQSIRDSGIRHCCAMNALVLFLLCFSKEVSKETMNDGFSACFLVARPYFGGGHARPLT